eukprot:TRINITY_DN74_c0_g1_i12.p2 TRINITY_DN74_c0_g1~~TRINITY_DN74_c0_g1_i12.p2  ORF type:complete len:517 (-),score=63.07 TRINITY_DN74_c0_g1_i12:4228-5778(-)
MMSQRLINPRSPHGTAILSEHEGAHPQTISTASHAANGLSYDPRAWSRVDWAVARYKWYRACGLLDDSPQQPTVITRYRRSPDPPRPKPHLKWYPLNKPDDEVATPYQRSGTATPSAPPRKRYDQRVEHAHVRTILARYQAEKEEAAKATGQPHPFDESKHDRVPKGSSHGGEFAPKGSVSPASESHPSPLPTNGQQVPTPNADRFAAILNRFKELHPNQHAYFAANRGSLADDGKTWDNLTQPLSWGKDNSVRIRRDANSDFEILQFIVNSISGDPNYKNWLARQIKSGAIKPPPAQPPQLWSSNAAQANAQREQWYQYMALAGATPNEIATLQNDVARHQLFGQGGYVETGLHVAGSMASAFNVKAGGTGGPLTFRSKANQSAAAIPSTRANSETGGSKSNVRANKAAGDAWEGELFQKQLPKIQNELQPQITLKSAGPSGKKVRIDAIGKDLETGEIRLTDGKASATAPHTPNQKIVYPELETHGGVVVGNGKPPYSGGTIIPPTKVDIIRKP